ncbi:MAG: DUF106 domain-containing protein [Thermoplasmatota archaeon]
MAEEENEEKGEDESSQSKNKFFDFRRFVYIFLGMIVLMMFIDPDLRYEFGGYLGKVLYPLIGFNSNYPVLTLILAGTIMIAFSTTVREFFMDWVEMAKNQKISSAFRKEMMEARKANKQTKLKKLQDQQPEINKLSMGQMKDQLKSMVFTMVVVISIFGWIWMFTSDLSNTTFSVPWALNANFNQPLIEACFVPFPQWIGVYMLISIPLGQVFMVLLKWYDFKSKLEEEEGKL